MLARAAFSLDGSTISLRDFATLTTAGDRVSGWWGDVRFGRGRVVLAQPPSLGADFQARLEDTRPLVAFYQLRRDLPRWAERLLTIRGVSASGRFDWSPGRLRFDDGFLPLPHGALRADADLEGTAKRARMLFTEGR